MIGNNIWKKKTQIRIDMDTYKENVKTFSRKVEDKLMTFLNAGIILPTLKGCGQ